MSEGQIKVLVTSAGTASAISFIKALRHQQELNVHIVAVDMDILAPGLHLADEHFLVSKASSPNYVGELLKIGQKTNSNLLIPIYSKEIAIIAANQDKFRQVGIKTLLPNEESIQTANNKFQMSIIASQLGIVTPASAFLTAEIAANTIKFPVFVKPNSSSSSVGAEKVIDPARLQELAKSNTELIVQEYAEGQEVTVDVLCNKEHVPIIIAPRLRSAIKSGQSIKGTTINNERFTAPITALCKHLKIVGVCNFQFFITPENTLVFIELNPRYAAGGLMLTVKAGANIPLQIVKMLLNMKIRKEDCIAKEGISMTRYWEEIILDENNKKI